MIQKLLAQGAELGAKLGAKLIDRQRGHQPKVLLFINLQQDLDMLLPLAVQLQQSEFSLAIAVTDKVWERSPRIDKLLAANGIQPVVLSHKAVVAGLQPRLNGIRAVVTASESTANAHKGPHTLVKRANQKGIATYTMQHGYENVGLTYFDAEYPVGKIMFASQTFFTWGPVEKLPDETPEQTRKKCVAVGCPKFVDAPGLTVKIPGIKAEKRLAVVFENLHWSRYSDDYRQHFLQNLEQTALQRPDITFLVKPHHTGLWLTQRYQGKVPVADNLIVADPKAPKWEAFTAPALIEVADVVITTPSTVAIDAVRAACPVAVVAGDMALPNFEPLPLLRCGEDWRSLCTQVANSDNNERDRLIALTQKFSQTQLVPGNAVQKIIDKIALDLKV